MTDPLSQLKTQVDVLAADEKAELAYYLLSSLGPSSGNVDLQWRAEINRRVSEIEAGTAEGVDADELFATLRKRYV